MLRVTLFQEAPLPQWLRLPLLLQLQRVRRHRRVEVDQSALGVAEQNRLVSPRHQGRGLHDREVVVELGPEAREQIVDVVDEELDDEAVVGAARGAFSPMNPTLRGWLSANVADGVTSSAKSSVSHRAVAPVTASSSSTCATSTSR
jgi:hypothetical protein